MRKKVRRVVSDRRCYDFAVHIPERRVGERRKTSDRRVWKK